MQLKIIGFKLEITSLQNILSFATLFILVAKWYHDHMTIKDLKLQAESKRNRLDLLEKEQVKVAEALDRTFVSKEYIFKYFFSREDIDEKLKHLDSTIKNELSHINSSIENLSKLIEKRSSVA